MFVRFHILSVSQMDERVLRQWYFSAADTDISVENQQQPFAVDSASPSPVWEGERVKVEAFSQDERSGLGPDGCPTALDSIPSP